MSAYLSDARLFEPRVPAAWQPLLDQLAALWSLTRSAAPLAERRREAAALRAQWISMADRLAEPLPAELRADAPSHRRWFAEAVLLWIHFGRVAGTPRLDTLKTRSLRSFPVDLESAEAGRPQIRAALSAAFGWTAAELDEIEAKVDRLISNLRIKQAIAAAFVEAALSHGPEGLHGRAVELMRDVYGPALPLRPGDVDLVVSGSAVYFCLAYRGLEFRGTGFAARPATERRALERFLERLKTGNTFRTGRFPAFGLYDAGVVSRELLARLHAAVEANLGRPVPFDVVEHTFGTMTMILPTELADQYLVHDAWGHGWQEALCEFEWLYGDAVHLRDPLDLDTGARAGLAEDERLGSAFVAVDGRTVLDEERLARVVDADLRHRIRAAGNTFLSEVLADLVEHKYVRRVQPDPADFPSSSLLPTACLKVDLSVTDARAYGRAWGAPYRRLAGRKAVRAKLARALVDSGLPRRGARRAVDAAATLITDRFAAALSCEFPAGDGSVDATAGVVQRLALAGIAMDAELEQFLAEGDARFDAARAADPAVARWQVPEACIDLLVVVLAWFYEQERDAYIWHLDELLREALEPSLRRFGEALRAT